MSGGIQGEAVHEIAAIQADKMDYLGIKMGVWFNFDVGRNHFFQYS